MGFRVTSSKKATSDFCLTMKDIIERIILESSEIIKNSSKLTDKIEKAVNVITDCIKNEHKIILFGNGGSATDAQHIAAEFIGRYQLERKSFPAIALTTDSSILTSIANDYSYDLVFSRQCQSLVENGDVVIGISTSGNSKNVIEGLKTSKQKGAITIGLLGNNGGIIRDLVEIPIVVNSKSTARVQEVHRIIYHIICELVEKNLSIS